MLDFIKPDNSQPQFSMSMSIDTHTFDPSFSVYPENMEFLPVYPSQILPADQS